MELRDNKPFASSSRRALGLVAALSSKIPATRVSAVCLGLIPAPPPVSGLCSHRPWKQQGGLCVSVPVAHMR